MGEFDDPLGMEVAGGMSAVVGGELVEEEEEFHEKEKSRENWTKNTGTMHNFLKGHFDRNQSRPISFDKTTGHFEKRGTGSFLFLSFCFCLVFCVSSFPLPYDLSEISPFSQWLACFLNCLFSKTVAQLKSPKASLMVIFLSDQRYLFFSDFSSSCFSLFNLRRRFFVILLLTFSRQEDFAVSS